MNLAFKVDVDTYEGMRDGVPRLLKLFAEVSARVSFFVPMGPDASGRGIFRVFRKKGFLKKMLRSNAVSLYGPKALLRGTLLPAPMIGASFPEILRQIPQHGHELGIHGYHHVRWQDHLENLTENKIRKEIADGVGAFKKVMGHAPETFAAPAWWMTRSSFKVLDEFQFKFSSDTRGSSPFYPEMDGVQFKTLQVPSTLPTADELLGRDGITVENIFQHYDRLLDQNRDLHHVHTIHTEGEGSVLFSRFSAWFKSLVQRKINPCSLSVFLKEIPQPYPVCKAAWGELPGRAGQVTIQKDVVFAR